LPGDAASLLKKARETRDDLEARLYLAAAVQRVALEVGARCVVSGGTSVDFYAGGAVGRSEAYPALWRASGDVDLVVFAIRGYASVRVKVLKALESTLGLRPRWMGDTARVVEVPDFPFGLEIVGDELNLDPLGENVLTVMLDGVHPVTLRGPEEVILAYAESGWHTRHTRDWERALAVYSAMKEHLDVDHLLRLAEARGQSQVIARVLAMQPLRLG
jgi:hypothetical protein